MNEQTEETRLPFAAEVWNTLSRVDVADHIETAVIETQKGGKYSYQYLSWSWCWATLMRLYPESCIIVGPEDRRDDGSLMVNMTVCIVRGPDRFERGMWLPVMDRKFNAAINPSARNINDTRWRCVVKALAFCGLGLDLWTGSDMPVGVIDDPIDETQAETIAGLLEQSGRPLESFLKWTGTDSIESIARGRYKETLAMLEHAIKTKSKS